MTFNEREHTYTDDDGFDYTSVTTLYGRLKRKKDWEGIAQRYAEKHGETGEYWLKVWEDNKNASANFGSAYHLVREEEIAPADMSNIKRAVNPRDLPDGTYNELTVWSPYYRSAGRVDRTEIIGDLVNLRDFKTCKKIDTEATAYYNRETRRRSKDRYLPPLSHMEVFNLNDFTLQMSMYGLMFEGFGFRVGTLTVEHAIFKEREKGYDHLLKTLKEGSLVQEIVEYQVPYLRKEALAILKNHRNSLKEW